MLQVKSLQFGQLPYVSWNFSQPVMIEDKYYQIYQLP